MTKFRNQHIGYVFQQYHLLKELTVLENIRLPLDIGRKAYDHSYEEELLDLLGLRIEQIFIQVNYQEVSSKELQ